MPIVSKAIKSWLSWHSSMWMVLSVLIGIMQFYILVSDTVITKENKHCFVKYKDNKLSFNHNQYLLTLYVSIKFIYIIFQHFYKRCHKSRAYYNFRDCQKWYFIIIYRFKCSRIDRGMTGCRCASIIFLRHVIAAGLRDLWGRCLTGTGCCTPWSAVKVVGCSLNLVYSTTVVLKFHKVSDNRTFKFRINIYWINWYLNILKID